MMLYNHKGAIHADHQAKRFTTFGYRRMIDLCQAGRAGTPDEVGTVGALLMGSDGAFITGSDFLMDGGVTASYWFGELAPK
jgi:hypothetical protein